MLERNTILIINDNTITHSIVNRMTYNGYKTVTTPIGESARTILAEQVKNVAAIIVDIQTLSDSTMEFMTDCLNSPDYGKIPLLVVSGDRSPTTEAACLSLGVWDYLASPFLPETLRQRLKNAIKHSTLSLVQRLQRMVDFDTVSGIYNKQHYFSVTHAMLIKNPDRQFALVHFNVEKFRLINAFFSMEAGDKFIVYIARRLRAYGRRHKLFTYGHISADIFSFCLPFEQEHELISIAKWTREELRSYPLPFNIRPILGITIVKDHQIDINRLYDQASLASRHCGDNYLVNYSFYNDTMSEQVFQEQSIINEMIPALEQHQFIVYLQPKYDLRSNSLTGAEALVRWVHPEQGLISPGKFIPVFERNGFITRLDYYIWKETCILLRRWLDQGKEAIPVSVNISRVDLFNPKLVEIISSLVREYDLPPGLLQLELTESAYTNNPLTIKETMSQLRERGFTILMDDFGAGYSSLNILKDIIVDVLKIDMRFLSDSDEPGRGENILASVVRMAKWLNLPVIAEGVETYDQVTFLRNIGCEYVQGYYFARPLPVADFEKLAFDANSRTAQTNEEHSLNADAIWSATSQMESLFSNVLLAMALYEFDGTSIELLRGNDAYYDLFGYQKIGGVQNIFNNINAAEDQERILSAFQKVMDTRSGAECDFYRALDAERSLWINIKLKYINTIGGRCVVLASLADITSQKMIEIELQKYRSALSMDQNQQFCVLIVDDEEVNRAILANIFHDDFIIAEAKSGKEAFQILQKQSIELILLDLVMPEMDGITFLHKKMSTPGLADIPVVITTADNSPHQQNRLLEMGVKDYIVKPFVPAVVHQRVLNVVDSIRHFNEKLRTPKE